MRIPRKWLAGAVIAVVVAVMAAGLALGYFGAAETVKALSIEGIKLNSIYVLHHAYGVGMNVSFKVSNPSGNDAELRNVTYEIMVNGVKVAEVGGQELSVGSSMSSEVSLQFSISDNKSLNVVEEALKSGRMDLGVKAHVTMPATWFGVAEFMNLERTLSATSSVNVNQILGAGKPNATTAPLTASQPPFKVVKVVWFAGGKEVYEVKRNTEVDLWIKIQANRDLSGNEEVRIFIVGDYKFFPDGEEKSFTIAPIMHKGETAVYRFTFTAKHHWALRGYYVEIGWKKTVCTGHYGCKQVIESFYTMKNSYPPRLKVD